MRFAEVQGKLYLPKLLRYDRLASANGIPVLLRTLIEHATIMACHKHSESGNSCIWLSIWVEEIIQKIWCCNFVSIDNCRTEANGTADIWHKQPNQTGKCDKQYTHYWQLCLAVNDMPLFRDIYLTLPFSGLPNKMSFFVCELVTDKVIVWNLAN